MAASGGVNIPNGLDVKVHAKEIADILAKILDALKSEGAKRVTSRLNCSDTEEPMPCWVATVEDHDIKDLRKFDAGLVRFGRINRSIAYAETVTDKNWDVHERDWCERLREKIESGYGPTQVYGPEAGCMYQLYVALRAKDNEGVTRNFGTVTASFLKRPTNRAAVDRIMKQWAESGEYIDYLTKKIGFDIGGPRY
jgi:hypothetical protein